MTLMVHLCPVKDLKKIERSGIKPSKNLGVVFAVPVVESYLVTHQWARELVRDGNGPRAAVYFEVDDQIIVEAGSYYDRDEKRSMMTAAEAAKLLRSAEDPMGFEVRIPTKIEPKAIKRTAILAKAVGWRYFPGAHGKDPMLPEPRERTDPRLPSEEDEFTGQWVTLPPKKPKLIWAGEYQETGNWTEGVPSVLEIPWKPLEASVKSVVLDFLRNSSVVLDDYAFWMPDDKELKLEMEDEGAIRSDGHWLWGSQLIELFEKFDVKLPEGLVESATRAGGAVRLHLNDRRMIGKEIVRLGRDEKIEFAF